MTGIERLRELAREQEERSWSSVGKVRGRMMREIADQIEHEQNKVAMTDWEAVRDVCGDMARHVSGIPEFDDLVDRWCRTLDDALDGRAGSVHDTADDREAAAWVREHGGLDEVKRRWKFLNHYADHVPRSCMERRLARLQRQIDECHEALRRRNERIEELGKTIEFFQLNNSNFRHLLADVAERLGFTRYGDDYEPEELFDALDRRLMPEGVEWPRYESGEPVRNGGAIADGLGHAHEVISVEIFDNGADLRWNPAEPEECVWVGHGDCVRRPAVPAADGEPLGDGQTVWHEDGTELKVLGFGDEEDGETIVRVEYVSGPTRWGEVRSLSLTHAKPEPPDSYCRLYADMAGRNGNARIPNGLSFGDFVRRCRALAERERGE